MSRLARVVPPALQGGLLLLLGTLFLFFEIVFRGQVLYYGDLTLYFLPELDFLRGELRAGQVPLWNPYVNCGQPFVGNPQTWVLYPSTLLLLLFETARANALSTVLHVFWAGWGTLGFLRQQRLSPPTAILGAVAFAFGGAFISKAQFPNMLQAMAWLPWLLWATEKLFTRRTLGSVGGLGLCVGLALLAAHAQVTLMQLYVLLAWVGFRMMNLPRSERLRTLGALTVAALLGLCLALAQLLPVVEYALASTRPHLSLGAANRFYLPWKELILLVAPNALGNPALATGWEGKGNFWEPCCYIGLLPLGLGLYFGITRRRAIPFWLSVAAVSLWLALGRYGGLYVVAFYVLPGVKQFHDPARWLYLTSFALAVLAAQGLEQVRLRESGKWLLVLVTLGELVSFSRTLNPTCAPEHLTALTSRAAAPTERVLHLRPFQAWKQLAPHKRYPEPTVALAGAGMTPNVPLLRRVPQAGGYEPVARRDIAAALKALGTLPQDPAGLTPTQTKQLEALGVRWVYGSHETRRLVSTLPRIAGATLLAERPGVLELQPTASVVVLRETHAAGWRAWADGVSVPIIASPPVFMEVRVPEGTKRVVFRYEPLSWRLGVFISGGAGCILVALMLSMLRNKTWQS